MGQQKVLHVINTMQLGGAQVLLANSLAAGGLQEHIDNYLVYFMGESSLLDRIDKNVKVISLNYKGISDLKRALSELKKIILDNQISIVHTHLTPADFYTSLILPKNVKQIHTLHSTYSLDHTQKLRNRILQKYLYLKRKDCNLIFLSDYNRDDFLRSLKFRGKSFVLNNFIADDFFSPDLGKNTSSPQPGLKVIAVGVLREEKNFKYLLDVFVFLKNYNIQLDIYGSGDKSSYEQIVKERQLKVRFLGEHAEVSKILCHYDLFISPSLFEGFGLSIFEAMASGVPVLSSDLESLKSLIGDNVIYFQLNNAEQVAQTIVAIYNDRPSVKGMAAKAKAFAEKTVKKEMYIKRLMDIYSSLAD